MLKSGDPQIDSLIRFGLVLSIFAIVDVLTRGLLGYVFLGLTLFAPLIVLLPLAELIRPFGGMHLPNLPQWIFGFDDKPKALVFAAVLLGISILLKTSNNRALRIVSLVFWFHALIIGMVLISLAIGGQEGMGR